MACSFSGCRSRRWEDQVHFLAEKVANLRIFEDNQGKTNLSVLDVAGRRSWFPNSLFMLIARKGRRPSFTDAAPPGEALPLVELFVEVLRAQGIPTQTGKFGEHMLVEIHNDGPVTIWLDR